MAWRISVVGAALSLILLGGTALAAGDFAIHVHLINGTTGKPVLGKFVKVVRVERPEPVSPGTVSAKPTQWREKTDSNGVATFILPGPPEAFNMVISMDGEGYDRNLWLQCNNPGFRGAEIVTKGVAREPKCPTWLHAPKFSFEAQPGDVYIFAAHISLWQHLRHCGPEGCN